MVIAKEISKYDTMGYDLIGMVADDAICVGAEVVSISNTIDVEKVEKDVITELMEGLKKACIEQKIVDGQRTCVNEYDRYKGMKELMPFAKGVSAKSHDFNEAGDEIHTDFVKMLQILKDSGFRGYIDVEYEGSVLSEFAGIIATKKLLEKAMTKLS